jgi:hypothetical protein
MREPVVMLPIRSRQVTRSERPGVWCGQDVLQQFDIGNGLFNIHPSNYLP